MNARAFADHIGVAQGTIKRWLIEGMPAHRIGAEHGIWIEPAAAKAWLTERFKGRETIAFNRVSYVYFAEAEDGRIKIGWSSDVMRRIHEIRKQEKQAVELIACFPGLKPDELRMHAKFKEERIHPGHEWFRPSERLIAFLRGRLAA